MKKLEIKHFYQRGEEVPKDWRSNLCGVSCVKMILDSYRQETAPNIKDLIDEGVVIGAYNEGMGWYHEGLVVLLRNHGISAYRQEYKSGRFNLESKEVTLLDDSFNPILKQGIDKIHEELEKGNSVIASVEKEFSGTEETHLILLVGFEEDHVGLEGFYYKDSNSEDSGYKYVELGKFKDLWRKLVIFVELDTK